MAAKAEASSPLPASTGTTAAISQVRWMTGARRSTPRTARLAASTALRID